VLILGFRGSSVTRESGVRLSNETGSGLQYLYREEKIVRSTGSAVRGESYLGARVSNIGRD